MTTFNVLAPTDVLTEKHIHIIVESFIQFFEQLTPKHQSKTHLHLLSFWPTSSMHNEIMANPTFNIHVTNFADRDKASRLLAEASLMFIPAMEEPGADLADLLICGIPLLCHHKSAVKKLVSKQFALFAGSTNTNKTYNDIHAIDDYANVLEMLYFDPNVQKLLKKKADKKYRRKMNQLDKATKQKRHQRESLLLPSN